MRLLINPGLPEKKVSSLDDGEILSILYHDIFNYPLNFSELVRWKASGFVKKTLLLPSIKNNKGFFLIQGKEASIMKRIMRKRISRKKTEIARKAAKILSLIPTVEMVGITGALAMENADEEADIDLLIVTKESTLWVSRGLAYVLLKMFRIPIRKPSQKENKDKLCLNIWLDNNALSWDKLQRNYYTAHEIAQMKPVFERGDAYDRFIKSNKWVLKYWPNAVKLRKQELRIKNQAGSKLKLSIVNHLLLIIRLLEPSARKIQKVYMRKRKTREIIADNRAIFHPVDWSEVVNVRFNPYLK